MEGGEKKGQEEREMTSLYYADMKIHNYCYQHGYLPDGRRSKHELSRTRAQNRIVAGKCFGTNRPFQCSILLALPLPDTPCPILITIAVALLPGHCCTATQGGHDAGSLPDASTSWNILSLPWVAVSSDETLPSC